MQGVASLVAHHVREQMTGNPTGKPTVLQNTLSNASAEVINRLYEGIATFQLDLANIKAGVYKLPWDMQTLTHRQYNPLYIMNR